MGDSREIQVLFVRPLICVSSDLMSMKLCKRVLMVLSSLSGSAPRIWGLRMILVFFLCAPGPTYLLQQF